MKLGLSLKENFSTGVTLLFSLLFTLPCFIVAHVNLYFGDWPFQSGLILLFLVIFCLFFLVLRLFKPFLLIIFVCFTGWVAYSYFTNGYGMTNAYDDYRAMLFSMQNNPSASKISFINPIRSSPYNIKKIVGSINYTSPTVRTFAVQSTNEFFKEEQNKTPEYRNLIQCFAVFKKINSNWNYVYDPKSRDYFATAGESVRLLAGDCDDHSILMAAAIKAIGGTPRLIITTGHIYPELYIGGNSDLERVNFLIKKTLFPNKTPGEGIHYHRDNDGKIWLNLDYTAKYPGGKYMAEPVLEIIYPE